MESPLVDDSKAELQTLMSINQNVQTLEKIAQYSEQKLPLDEQLIESQAQNIAIKRGYITRQ